MENVTNGATAPEKKLNKKLVTALAVVLSIIGALAVMLMVWYLGDKYPDFERRFSKEMQIPALDEGLVPQGMGNYDNKIFVSGYMNDGSPSRIYLIENGETTGYVTVKTDGKDYAGHACGVASNGSKVWLVSDGTVYVLKYTDVITQAKTNGTVETSTTWKANCNADFCYYDDSYIYVGEFYRKGNYETDESHRFTTPAGDENTALILRYSAYSTNPTTPSRAYSITGEIQGMAMNDDGDRIVLSQSYGLSNSHILTYEFSSSSTSYSTTALKINGSSVRMYYLDSANLVSDYEVPSMSEGLCSSGDKIYVLFESGSKKYGAFVRERIDHIYSFRVRK